MKLTLHIGTEKTGTTSIQRALAADREALAARGILYPRLFGSENHMELAVGAMAHNPRDELQLIELKRQDCDHPTYIERLKIKIGEERRKAPYTRMIASNEHCHSRLRDSEAVRRLLDFFEVDGADCELIVYLRRQDRLAASVHSTRLKLGGQGDLFPAPSARDALYYFRFDEILDNYAKHIPAQNINVRLFEPARLTGSDVVADFYAAAGLDFTPSLTPRANQSLSNTQVLFLARFNEFFPLIVDGRINQERGPIYNVIRDIGLGDPFRPPRHEALTFYESFRANNDAVRARYLPALDRPTLFDEVFSDYPETASTEELDADTLFEFIAAIWRFRQGNQQ